MNKELDNLNEWFRSNKLSLNVDKTKCTFFHKKSKSDDIPLKLPDLCINNINICREKSMKFLGVLLDDHLTWTNHINLIENKISKNIGILYKAKNLLNQSSLKHIYFSFIHSYINYATITWSSTYPSRLKRIHSIQKHGSRIIFNKRKHETARPLLKSIGALNTHA